MRSLEYESKHVVLQWLAGFAAQAIPTQRAPDLQSYTQSTQRPRQKTGVWDAVAIQRNCGRRAGWRRSDRSRTQFLSPVSRLLLPDLCSHLGCLLNQLDQLI